MELKHIIFLLFVSSLAFVSKGEEEVVACTTSEAECANDGWSALSVINDEFYCCGAGLAIEWGDNNTCTCVQRGEGSVVACQEGSEACANASTVTVNVQNVTRCCPDDFRMQSLATSVNGVIVSTCTCSQYTFDNETGVVSTGNSIFITNIQTGPGVNASDLLDDLFGVSNLGESGDQIGDEFEQELEEMAEEMDAMFNGYEP